jgi:glycosyltransferase involved in cell wall biosynthesis
MLILHVTDDLSVGGSQLVLTQLANSQVASGHHVAVAAGSGELWSELSAGITRYEHSGGRLRRSQLIPHIRRLLLARPWDIVHTHQRGVSTAVWLTRHGHSLRHVEHVHNVFSRRSWDHVSFRGDALIACGSAVARMLVEDYGRAPSRVHTIPNGIQDHGVRRSSRNSGPLRIVNIARVDEVKDPVRFIRTVDAVWRGGQDVRATWIGDGNLLGSCRRLVDESGLSGVVDFPGGRRPAVNALAEADVVFLTSLHEGLPLSVIEAGAAACAVVAPDVGSLTDVIEHGHNGWLYRPSAPPEEIAILFRDVGTRPEELDKAGMHAREVYERAFEFSRVSAQVEDVYSRLFNGR